MVGVYLMERVMVTSLDLFKDADNKGVATEKENIRNKQAKTILF